MMSTSLYPYQIEALRYQAEVEQFRADARRFRIAEKNLFDVQEAAKIIAKQAIAAEAERDALAAKLKEVDGRIDDLLATCHRLALELECLLLDTKDSASVSRWWDSAMAALDGWHKAKDAASARPVPAEPVNARLLDALKLAECVYRKNVVNEGEPSSVLEAMQAAITAAEAQLTDYSSTVDRAWARFCGAFGDGPDASYPGMIAAFETHYGQSFRDKEWRTEAACWAAAWSKATARADAKNDSYRLDALEAVAKASGTGVSFDWCRHVEDGMVVEHGYRMMWKHTIGPREKSIRHAIDAAMGAFKP